MKFIGTSSLRAQLLIKYGWHETLPAYDNLASAQLHAHKDVCEDGGFPVIITQEAAGFKFHSRVPNSTPQERCGFESTAGLGSIITSLLDGIHQHLRKAIDVGAGHTNVDLPALRDIHDKFKNHIDRVKHKISQHFDKLKNKQAGAQKKAQQKNQGPIKTTRGPTKPKAATQPTPPKQPTPPTQPKQAKQPTKPATNANPATKAPVAKKVPKMKVSGQTVKVRGKINGRAATTTVSKGVHYKMVKTAKGYALHRPGGRGNFIVSPGDMGKL